MTLEPGLFQLWHFGTKRCVMTPREGPPPFTVGVHDGDALLSQTIFEHHNDAVAFAVEALRAATTSAPAASSPPNS
jgi:hypothetical protein